MIKVGIIGISGYSGELALNLLLYHPQVRVTYVSANKTTGKVDVLYPYLKGKTNLVCQKTNIEKAIELCDLIFLAVPHTTSMKITPKLLKAKKLVIDLSGDYRFKDAKEYSKWYGATHTDKGNLSRAVYGLPELYRHDIPKTTLIANPGCYPTAAILGLAPIVATKTKNIRSIIIDAKSGMTGAGRKVVLDSLFAQINESIKAYKILEHQHAPEIEFYLSRLTAKAIKIAFVPHVIPINRGILETIYVQFDKTALLHNVHDVYKKFYKKEPFVRVLNEGQQPEIRNVTGTNTCEIGLTVSQEKKMLVIISAIDNLMKGAAGQAVQNMNILCGFKETAGLK